MHRFLLDKASLRVCLSTTSKAALSSTLPPDENDPHTSAADVNPTTAANANAKANNNTNCILPTFKFSSQ